MADFNYDMFSLGTAAKDKLREVSQEGVKPTGIGAKPADEQEPMDKGFYESMYDAIMTYFDDSEEADRVLKEDKPDRDAIRSMTLSEFDDITLRSAEEAGVLRQDMGKTEAAVPEERKETRLVDVTDTELGKLDNVKPLEELAEDIDPGTIDTESLDADGVQPTDGKGLMSPRLDRGDDILPPKSVFINKADTSKGDTERELYKEAYQAGLSGDELKAFMAQVAHESSSFGRIEERGYSWSKNYKNMPQVWKDRLKRDGVTEANGSAENIFNSVYANRLGNGDYASGDGNRYRGRGYIQLTGKDNYRTIGEAIGEDLIGNPDLMSDPAIARKASIAWWKLNVRGNVPDDDYTDINAVSGLVNRGSATRTASGLEDRKKKFAKYNEKVTNSRTSPRPMLRPEEEDS